MADQESVQRRVLQVETRDIEPVPDSEKHGSPRGVFTVWFGANMSMATWVVGSLGLAFGLGLEETLVAIVLGNLIGMAALGLVSAMGPKAGVPQMILTRSSFGYRGTLMPAAFNWLASVGWFAVNTIIGVLALEQLLHLPYIACVILLVAGQIVLAVYGHDMIHAFEKWMTYTLSALFVVATALVALKLGTPHGHAIAMVGFHPAGFILLLGAIVGNALGWSPYGADYSRYLPGTTPRRRVFTLTFAAGLLSAVWIESLGAVVAAMALTSSSNPVQQMAGVMGVFSVPMLVAAVLGMGTANVISTYSGALSALVMGLRARRWKSALAIGVLGTGLLLAAGTDPLKLQAEYTSYLLILAYWIAPWLAIVLADFYRTHRGSYSTPDLYVHGGIRWPGLIAYTAGLATSVPFMAQQTFTGIIARTVLHGADISIFIGFLVAGSLYILLQRQHSAGTPRILVAQT
jgi:nucleobase:cation symporter-1, NCS1 family